MLLDGWNIAVDANLSYFLSDARVQTNVSTAFYKEAQQMVVDYGESLVQIVPFPMLDRYRQLEKACGVKMKDVENASSLVWPLLPAKDIANIPMLNESVLNDVNPVSYDMLLKVFGWGQSWGKMKDRFFDRRMSLDEIPAFCEELYDMLCARLQERGITDDGLAADIVNKVNRRSFVLGMGGGCGTGALPYIAQLAKERDIEVYAVVTTPA